MTIYSKQTQRQVFFSSNSSVHWWDTLQVQVQTLLLLRTSSSQEHLQSGEQDKFRIFNIIHQATASIFSSEKRLLGAPCDLSSVVCIYQAGEEMPSSPQPDHCGSPLPPISTPQLQGATEAQWDTADPSVTQVK